MGGIKQIYKFETNLDDQTATIVFDPKLGLGKALDALAEKSAQMIEWSIQ